jgi:hypothetical protein
VVIYISFSARGNYLQLTSRLLSEVYDQKDCVCIYPSHNGKGITQALVKFNCHYSITPSNAEKKPYNTRGNEISMAVALAERIEECMTGEYINFCKYINRQIPYKNDPL